MKVRYYERTPDSWWLDFRDHEGRRIRVPSGQTTRSAAERAAPAIISAALAQRPISAPLPAPLPSLSGNPPLSGRSSSLTLGQAFKQGMRDHEGWVDSKSRHTLEQTFGAILASSPGLTEDTLCQFLTRDSVLELRALWKAAPGKRKNSTLSNSTINHRLSMLSVLLAVAGLLPHGVKHLSTKGNSRKRRVTDRDLQQMHSWCLANAQRKGALDFADLMTLGMETAAREGELLSLLPADVQGDLATFRDTKNGTTRTIPLTEVAQRLLEGRRGRHMTRFFPDLDADRITRLWDDMRAAMGLQEDHNFVFHLLRHEAAARLVESGASAFVIQALLGHADIKTSEGYVMVGTAAVRQALANRGSASAP